MPSCKTGHKRCGKICLRKDAVCLLRYSKARRLARRKTYRKTGKHHKNAAVCRVGFGQRCGRSCIRPISQCWMQGDYLTMTAPQRRKFRKLYKTVYG